MKDEYSEFIKSMINLSWSIPLFGAKQLAEILFSYDSNQLISKTVISHAVTSATKEQDSDVISLAFCIGDRLQKSMLNLIFSFIMLDGITPRCMMKTTFDIMQQSAEVFGLLMPWQDNRLSLWEFKNKLQTFSLFEYVDLVLNLPVGTDSPLIELVEKAEALEPYVAVWVTEGLGRHYAETFWKRQQVPRELLTDAHVSALPPKSLIPLHTGMGLSFADRLMRGVKPQSHVAEIRAVLQQFATLCKENAREGYTGAVIEGLGLVVRNRYPHMVPIIDQQLAAIDFDMLAYFWHGVGRGLYFLPSNSVPWASLGWRVEEMLQLEAPHTLGRLNVLAGLAWALTLVNIRYPEILETFLKHHGDLLSTSDAFANGVSSATMIWYDMTWNDPYLKAFCRHQPDPSDPDLVKLWNRQVRGPCLEALQHHYGMLKEQHRLGEVFRYQSLPELVD